jgi:hypothetical protein
MNVLTSFTQYIFVWVIFLTLFKSVSALAREVHAVLAFMSVVLWAPIVPPTPAKRDF